ncbi:hypothetical protein D3C84_1090310 [compost metagenome]
MGHHQHTGAVGYQNHWPVDLFQLMLNGMNPGGAIELIGFKGRYAAHIAQAVLEQCLPMLGNMLAQTGHNQNGCGSL